MKRISRDARLLFVLLWTVVDDEGRCLAAPGDLAAALYPADVDVPHYMRGWLDELEGEGCIERYAVDDVDYLRVVHWHKHQWVGHPTPSSLPASPSERLRGSGIPEASGKPGGRRRKPQADQALEARSHAFPENVEEKIEDDGAPVVVTRETVLRDLRRIQRNAEADGAHPSALKSVELTAKIGLAPDKSGEGAAAEERSLSPAELFGLPITRPIR